ncbi:MAG: hypothetical protein QOC55_1901 [Thermoleophilaceae bacterium]|nr:hypothetical protein [Thermoleophilaceae bacterium]
MQTTPLNVLDELYLHLDREDEAWSVHVEIRVEQHIDADSLRSAVAEAAAVHPMARARLAPARPTDVSYSWEISDTPPDIDVVEIDCRQGDDLSAARERLLGGSPSLERPGPFTLLLAHDAGGDVLVLNLHHAAGDGLSAVRLMQSIARAYSGEEDPMPEVDALAARDVSAIAAPSIKERLTRGRAALDYVARGVSPPTRLTPAGERDRAGYGFAFLSLDPAEVEQLLGLRREGATVNDVLLAGLAVAVRRWNEAHGDGVGAVYLMMPINLRPPEWRDDVLGNFASYVSVRLGPDEHLALDAAIPAAATQTRRVKDGSIAGLIIDLFGAPTLLPTGLKRRMADLIPLSGNVVVDTAVLSNLGRISEVPVFGDAGAVREIWFSPPGRMPLGASLGVATLGDRLFMTLRYRHAQFGQAAAEEFLTLFKRVLAGSM